MNLYLALIFLIPGYKNSAVHIRTAYSTQKIPTVTYSIALNNGNKNASSLNVSKNVTNILDTIVIVMNISKKRLILLLLSPICMILKIFSFITKLFPTLFYHPFVLPFLIVQGYLKVLLPEHLCSLKVPG